MRTNKDKRRAKKDKVKADKKKSKLLRIRTKIRSEAKAEKETELLKKEVEKIQFKGSTIRKSDGQHGNLEQ